MTWTFASKFVPVAVGSVLAAATLAATALATSGAASAQCDNSGAVEAQQTGECLEKDNQAAQAPEAPLKAAWEEAFGPLPSPQDFALARVENPSVALPGVGLPGIGVSLADVGAGASGAAAAAGSAMSAMAAAPPTLPAAPALPAAPPMPGPPPMPCVGFGTPIPFVGFSTC